MPKKEKTIYYTLGYKDEIRNSFSVVVLVTACMKILYTNPKLYYNKGIANLTDNGKLIFRCRRGKNSLTLKGISNYLLSQLDIDQYESLLQTDIEYMLSSNYYNYFKSDLTL